MRFYSWRPFHHPGRRQRPMSPLPKTSTPSPTPHTYSLKPKAYRLHPRASHRFHQKPRKPRTAPTHARHKSCKRKKSRVSLYVTFDSARLARDSRDCIHPRHLDPSIPWPLFSPIVTLVLDAFCARMGATGGWRTARTEVRGSSKCGAYLWEFDDRVWNVDANYDVATHKGWRYSGGAKTAAIWGGATEEGRVLGSSLG